MNASPFQHFNPFQQIRGGNSSQSPSMQSFPAGNLGSGDGLFGLLDGNSLNRGLGTQMNESPFQNFPFNFNKLFEWGNTVNQTVQDNNSFLPRSKWLQDFLQNFVAKFSNLKGQNNCLLLAINQLLFLTVLKHLANNLILLKLSFKREKNFVNCICILSIISKERKLLFILDFFFKSFKNSAFAFIRIMYCFLEWLCELLVGSSIVWSNLIGFLGKKKKRLITRMKEKPKISPEIHKAQNIRKDPWLSKSVRLRQQKESCNNHLPPSLR